MNVKLHGKKQGFRAVIESEAEYNDILLGNKDIKPEHREKVTHYDIPAPVFERLLDLDRKNLKAVIKIQKAKLKEDDPRIKVIDSFLAHFPDEED